MSDPRRTEGQDGDSVRDTELVAIVELLLAATSGNGMSWRVPQDAVDQAYDKLVDRIVEGFPPNAPRSWVLRVLLNSFRAGPERAELRSTHMRELPEEATAPEPADESNSRAARRRFVDQLDVTVRGELTESEYAAYRAMLTEPSMAAAARASGMSNRDLQIRRARIVEKIRRLMASGESESGSKLK